MDHYILAVLKEATIGKPKPITFNLGAKTVALKIIYVACVLHECDEDAGQVNAGKMEGVVLEI